MATMWEFKKPDSLSLPDDYESLTLENGDVLFVKKLTSELEGFDKYLVGRKTIKTHIYENPNDTEINREEVELPVSYVGYIYVNDGEDIFLVGEHSLKVIMNAVNRFFNLTIDNLREYDLGKLEENAFREGDVGIKGHQYTQGNVRYTVRKIDGTYFEKEDNDYKSHEEVEKDRLDIQFSMANMNPNIRVYTEGIITSQGRTPSEVTPFQLLYTVRDVVMQLLQSHS